MLLNAILPIFLLIVLGYGLKHFRITDDAFWRNTEQLTYYVFFPALLISKLSSTELAGIDISTLAKISILSLLLISATAFALKPILALKAERFGSVYQGAIRFNTYIGLALISSLFDSKGLTTAIIMASISIPAVNLLSVFVLQTHRTLETRSTQHSKSKQLFSTVHNLAKNPLILGCLIGISINLLDLPQPTFLFETITILGSIALPLGLMAVGAALQLHNISDAITAILTSSVLKLLLYPCIVWLFASMFHLDTQTMHIMIIFSALPTATSSYILAKNMHSDHQLMARIITIETLLSCLTLLLIIKLLNIA